MKKSFAMQDLDCANCASKMENAIKKIDGVNDCSINFFAQKMILDADDTRFEDIVKKAAAAIKKVDPDCSLIVK
ncbi:MAG: cation transporter [Clostridia bacterium]|nr:cation transporter [Clostridia bacterium]